MISPDNIRAIFQKPEDKEAFFRCYWAAFITLGCNARCGYCIQDNAGRAKYTLVPGKAWVEALNSIEDRRQKRFFRPARPKKITIIGGEPALHPDFFYIVNNLDNSWVVTVDTNLDAPVFKDLDKFLSQLKKRPRLKFHVSFHPQTIDADVFINRVKTLQKKGLKIKRVFIVAYPPDDLSKVANYKNKFTSAGLNLEVLRYMGFYKDRLYPQDALDLRRNYADDGVRDYALFENACSLKEHKPILCKIRKILFAPNGNIYNCHYKLYTGSSDFNGNLFDENSASLIPKDYFSCKDFGFCNPCDFAPELFK